jgi:hypothetical protein
LIKPFLNFIIIGFLLSLSVINTYASERIALVIGNSNYKDLGTLKNTPNDARAMGNSLRELGYNVTLVLDASEGDMRKSVRKFSSDSDKSSLALVFYAGHGAQVNGENYLLPVDMEIPKTESDIQLQGFKVDDLINSLRSKTKVVFLDACRDNPALIKNLAKGRGSYRGGLAPAKTGSIEDQSSGIFIAYATDSGNVALDGEGQNNSPFTSALLKYIKNPVSIDDMFSMVTKEVRQSTKNIQRPYKYASLDGIVCIPGTCFQNEKPPSSSSGITTYDNTVNKKNWVLYTSANNDKSLVYLDPNSLKRYKNRINIDVKYEFEKKFLDNNPEKQIKTIEQSLVLDCTSTFGNIYLDKKYGWDDKILTDRVWGDFESVTLSVDYAKGSIGNYLKILTCDTNLVKPLVEKNNFNSENWKRFFTISDGVDIYYYNSNFSKKRPIEVLIKISIPNIEISKIKETTGVPNIFEEYTTTPKAKFMFAKIFFDCNGNYIDRFSNYFDSDGNLISYGGYGYLDDVQAKDILKFTPLTKGLPLELLSSKLCKD